MRSDVLAAIDGRIVYKSEWMRTVALMRKRNFLGPAGMMMGLGVSVGFVQLALLWGLIPARDLTRSAGYLREVLQIVNENYVDPKASGYDALTRNAIHGMVESLDPHSEYMESKDNAELEEDLSGEFGGIGVEVDVRLGHIMVITPIAGSPGDRAGIKRGDEITSIDGKVVDSNSTMDDVVDKLRGKPHTTVALRIFRADIRKELNFKIVREIIKVDSVTDVQVLDHDIGYLQITEFSEHTGEQFDAALNNLFKRNIGALVIDLRNNPGGLLDSAVDVAEPFFRKGELIVYTQGRKSDDREDYRAEADGEPLDLPVAILINSDTASAAEVVTGALKDTGRAVVVGERSFGKGSVQSIFKLKDGEGLRLTTAHYFTPSGITIHEKGIEPQVEVVLAADEDSKIRQQNARPDVTDPAEFKKLFGFAPIADRQLEGALDVLKGVEILDEQAEAAKAPKVHAGFLPLRPELEPVSRRAAGAGVQYSGTPLHRFG
jgi:carboxyl-terminal processing protease